MSQKKLGVDAQGTVTLLKSAQDDNVRTEAEELLDEIDNLAVLLHEIKQQTDRIEAAADAIGDVILDRLGPDRATSAALRTPKRPVSAKTSARVRTLSARVAETTGIRF